MYFYNAGHAFFNDQNHLGTYNEELARLAWNRTVTSSAHTWRRGYPAVAVMWGSSFLLIKAGVHSFSPTTVAWLRLLFGVALLSCFPAARKPLRRADRAAVALLGLVWMAGPFVLFPLAERSIPSALAVTINGAAPRWSAGSALPAAR